jgi:hypothetical protein
LATCGSVTGLLFCYQTTMFPLPRINVCAALNVRRRRSGVIGRIRSCGWGLWFRGLGARPREA